MKRNRPRRELFACPQCGADVAVGAKVCRECGSDAETGWLDSEQIDYASTDLPEGYAVDAELGGTAAREGRSWWVAAVAVLVALALLALTVWR